MKLKRSDLLKQKAYIDGAWVDADSGATNSVTNPANGDVLGKVPDMGTAETARAIEAANKAFQDWSKTTARKRAGILRKWYDLIMDNADDLALLMTLEQGKPLAEAKGEIAYGASFIEWFAEEAKRVYGDVIPTPADDRRLFVIRQPIGVVAAITPWNFPSAMLTRKAGPAIAAGCTVVAKPAEDTPYSALALAALAEEAGLPKGVLNIVTGDAKTIGEEMCANPIVRKLSFTGSTEVGRILMRQSSDTIKKLSLELGGNASFIVFDDADLEAAVEGAVACKFRNAGQTCVCANRIFVHDAIYDDFVDAFVAKTRELKVGNGWEEGVTQGPLINADAIKKVEDHIRDAKAKGGKVVLGGNRHALGGTFFEPTVIRDVSTDMKVCCEETFGPVAPIFHFRDEEEVVKMANDTEFGLANYFYARDVGRIWRVAEGLESGIIGVNTGIISTEVAPFGGVKQSGLGREGSKYGIEEFVEMKYINMVL